MKTLLSALKICSGGKCLQQMTPHNDHPSANLLLEQLQTGQMCVPIFMLAIYLAVDIHGLMCTQMLSANAMLAMQVWQYECMCVAV